MSHANRKDEEGKINTPYCRDNAKNNYIAMEQEEEG